MNIKNKMMLMYMMGLLLCVASVFASSQKVVMQQGGESVSKGVGSQPQFEAKNDGVGRAGGANEGDEQQVTKASIALAVARACTKIGAAGILGFTSTLHFWDSEKLSFLAFGCCTSVAVIEAYNELDYIKKGAFGKQIQDQIIIGNDSTVSTMLAAARATGSGLAFARVAFLMSQDQPYKEVHEYVLVPLMAYGACLTAYDSYKNGKKVYNSMK